MQRLKATLLGPQDLALLAAVPRGSPLVLDLGSGPVDGAALARCSRSHQLARLLLTAESLADPRLEAAVGHGAQVLVRLDRAPTLAEALAHARRLSYPELQVELPLETDEHLDVLKVITSLGLAARLPLRALGTRPELVGEAMADAMARPGKRAPLGPFADLERGFFDDDFELAQLDPVGNDHHVDLRGAAVAPDGAAWDAPEVSSKRLPFLLERRPCAFCEGLCYCHGYLFSESTFDVCRATFSEFMQLYDRLHARKHATPERSAGPVEGGPTERRSC